MENINQVTQMVHGKKQSTVANDNEDFTKMSDKKLLQICSHYGRQALMWRMKFIGLLPEVNRRKLFERKGFASIFEFGKRMAGLSEEQIRLALNLEKRFEDKPSLREALVEGRISINKLARVVSIATSENEEFLAESAKVLSKSSLEVFVRDIQMQNGLFEPQINPKSLPGQTEAGGQRRLFGQQAEITFQLNGKVIEKLNELNKKGLDVNEILLQMLEKREADLTEKKAEMSQKVMANNGAREELGKAPSRYVSVGIKKLLRQEFGNKCSVPTCKKPANHIHHEVPFSLTGSNDPSLLAPLCREHHDIVHSVNSKYVAQKFR